MTTWALHLALPLLGCGCCSPGVRGKHAGAHFWLVLGTAAGSLGLALRTGEQAGRHADARLVLVSLAFACAAGFLGLHALATPRAARRPERGVRPGATVNQVLRAAQADGIVRLTRGGSRSPALRRRAGG